MIKQPKQQSKEDLEQEIKSLLEDIDALQEELNQAEFQIEILQEELAEQPSPILLMEPEIIEAARYWRDAMPGHCKEHAEIALLDALKKAGY